MRPGIKIMLTPEKKYDTYLKSKNQRLTEARKIIFDYLFSVHSHLKLDDIRKEAEKNNISRATLFRILNQMIDAELIQKFFDDKGQVYYEHIYEHTPHHHLICTKCNKITEFEDPDLHKFLEDICKKNNFIHHNHIVEVMGVCDSKC